MKAEYFPPKEDVILQNEAPTDFYILVTGAVVITCPYPQFCKTFLLFFLDDNNKITLQELLVMKNRVEQASQTF